MSYPETITARELHDLVRQWHHTPEDLWYGDLGARINQYDTYRLTRLPIANVPRAEWSLNEDQVADFARREQAGEEMPPIIFDPVGRSIIDGTHRTNARYLRGQRDVLAYVGVGERLEIEKDEDDA